MEEIKPVITSSKGPCGKRSGEPNPSQCTSKKDSPKGYKE